MLPACSLKNTSHGDENRHDWFEQRRDFFIRQLFDDFFAILRSFQTLYLLYLGSRESESAMEFDLLAEKNAGLRSQIWDRLTMMVGTELNKGPLWQLKDLCHRLWPEEEQRAQFEGSLIDWFIGSIFHEAMKLKENIYILGSYGPTALKRRDSGSLGGGAQNLAHVLDVSTLVRRVVLDVHSQLNQLAFLFGRTSYLLRTMLPGLSANVLLVRLLAEREQMVFDLWSEEREALFSDMFSGRPEQGFCVAGKGYLSGQWLPQARMMYEHALRIDEHCQEARRQLISIADKTRHMDGMGEMDA